MKPRRLSEDEFTRACAKSRLKPATHAIARAVFVEGKKQIDVAGEVGASRSWVNQVVVKFWRQFEEIERSTVPKGWRTEAVSLPTDVWPAVRKIEREARARLKKSVLSHGRERSTADGS